MKGFGGRGKETTETNREGKWLAFAGDVCLPWILGLNHRRIRVPHGNLYALCMVGAFWATATFFFLHVVNLIFNRYVACLTFMDLDQLLLVPYILLHSFTPSQVRGRLGQDPSFYMCGYLACLDCTLLYFLSQIILLWLYLNATPPEVHVSFVCYSSRGAFFNEFSFDKTQCAIFSHACVALLLPWMNV